MKKKKPKSLKVSAFHLPPMPSLSTTTDAFCTWRRAKIYRKYVLNNFLLAPPPRFKSYITAKNMTKRFRLSTTIHWGWGWGKPVLQFRIVSKNYALGGFKFLQDLSENQINAIWEHVFECLTPKCTVMACHLCRRAGDLLGISFMFYHTTYDNGTSF